MRIFSYLAIKHAKKVIVAGFALATIGGYYSYLLYKNLRPNIDELLPTEARSLKDLQTARNRLESIDNIAILIFSENIKASRRFVDDLAKELSKAPKHLVTSVEYKITRELEFFDRRKALYTDLSDLIIIRNYIREKITYEKELHNPLNIFSYNNLIEPKLDFEQMIQKYQGKISTYSHFPDGYYASHDEKKRVILVYGRGSAEEIGQIKALSSFVKNKISELNPRSYATDMTIRFSGNIQNTLEEQQAILDDIKSSGIIVLLVILVSMILFFGSTRAALAILTTIFLAVSWTIGSAYFLIGELNSNSAFLGSIIVGNGINFSIIFASRFLELMRYGKTDYAIENSIKFTHQATWAAALAASFSYGSLMLTSFRGFKQFGIIGLTGMLLSWLAAFTVLPALLKILNVNANNKKSSNHIGANLLAGLIRRGKSAILIVSAICAVVAIILLPSFNSNILEADLTKLRSKKSMTKGSGHYSRYVDEIFQRYLSPIIVLPNSIKETNEIAKRLKQKQKELPHLISSVQTLDDFLPKDQEEKIVVLKQIRTELPKSILSRLSPKDRQRVRSFLTNEANHEIQKSDLPNLILDRFRERDGSLGKMVLVEPPIGATVLVDRAQLFSLVETIRKTADSVATDTPVAGQLVITTDILHSVMTDGPRATIVSFMGVLIVILGLFRNYRTFVYVLGTLTLGILWLIGLILAFQIKINFLNFVAIPLTFGIGIDYGINMFQRYQQEGKGSILEAVVQTGAAVSLSAWTTIVAYGSLLFASNKAFFSFGYLAVLGEITCTLSALLVIPAITYFFDHKVVETNIHKSKAA